MHRRGTSYHLPTGGAIYFDTAMSAFRGCDGAEWLTLAASRNGKDQATISLYYSDGIMHRRGYRIQAVEAPLKENLAAAALRLTRDYLAFLRQAMGDAAHALEDFEAAYAKTDWSRFERVPLFRAANRMNAFNTYLLMEQQGGR